MTLDYYRIFYYVARYKSFSNAAEMLGSNQPNITRCMNILENELDCKLLIRSHKGIQLTTEASTCSATLPLQLNSSPMEKRNYQKQEPRKRADQYRHQ